MAVAFDAASESHTGTTGSVSVASFNWTHTTGASPSGVVVFAINRTSTANDVTAVTYGGVSMSVVPGGRAVDATTEIGACQLWFLGSSIPSGNQTVVVTRNNNTNNIYAVAFTVTADTDTEVYLPGIVLLQDNQALSEQNVDDGSPGTNSLRFAAAMTGLGTLPAAGANSTIGPTCDIGSSGYVSAYETTAGQGSRPVGFTGLSDNLAAVHVAVREIPPSGVPVIVSGNFINADNTSVFS